MTTYETLDRSGLLGFDRDGNTLWEVAVSKRDPSADLSDEQPKSVALAIAIGTGKLPESMVG